MENKVPSSSVRNFDLQIYNDGTSNIDADIRQQSQGSILSNPQEYRVAISRFRVPLTSVEIMKVEDALDTNYKIEFQLNTVGVATAAAFEYSGTSYFSTRTIHPIYTPSDFVEEVNRCISRAWFNLIDDNADFSSFVETSIYNNVAFSTAGTLVDTNAVALTSTSCYGVKLTLYDFNNVSSSGAERDLINIDLVNPAGSVCRVAAGIILEAGHTYVFHVGGQKDQGSIDYTLDSTYSYQPLDSFLKFANEATNGNWSVRISPCGENDLDITVDYILSVYAPPTHASDTNRYALPNLQPNLSLDSSGYFSWTTHDKFIRQNMKIVCGPYLMNALSLQKIANSTTIRFPISLLSAGLEEVSVFRADSPKLFAINRISKVLIYSDLPVSKDIENNDRRSFALTSFQVPSDGIEQATELEYDGSSAGRPWRLYDVMTGSDISNFNISARVQYYDGSISVIQLEPGQLFSIMLSFFAVNK